MSDTGLNSNYILSKDKWALIQAKANESWKNNEIQYLRRKSISILHEKAVVIKDSNGNIIESPSHLKVAEYLGVSRAKVKTYLDSGNLLDSKLGPVLLIDNCNSKKSSIEIQVLDANKNILSRCNSLRLAGKNYGVTLLQLVILILIKNKLCKGKYYYIKVKKQVYFFLAYSTYGVNTK